MITVTLGTIPIKFNRVIEWIKSLIDEGSIDEPLFVQHGVSDVSCLLGYNFVTTSPLVTHLELESNVKQSRLVISHAGQGSTRWLARQVTPFIIVPRLAKYQEHIDNHQFLFAKSVEPFGVHCCLSIDEVRQSIIQPPLPLNKELLAGPKLTEHLIKSFGE